MPVITRWNLTFHAVQKVVINNEKLLTTFDKLKFKKLKIMEWTFFEENYLMMKLLATSVDLLQGEKSCFLGYVASTIIDFRLKLIQSSHLIH